MLLKRRVYELPGDLIESGSPSVGLCNFAGSQLQRKQIFIHWSHNY